MSSWDSIIPRADPIAWAEMNYYSLDSTSNRVFQMALPARSRSPSPGGAASASDGGEPAAGLRQEGAHAGRDSSRRGTVPASAAGGRVTFPPDAQERPEAAALTATALRYGRPRKPNKPSRNFMKYQASKMLTDVTEGHRRLARGVTRRSLPSALSGRPVNQRYGGTLRHHSARRAGGSW